MKKKIVMAMMLCMCAAVTAGCSQGSNQETETTAATEGAAETTEAAGTDAETETTEAAETETAEASETESASEAESESGTEDGTEASSEGTEASSEVTEQAEEPEYKALDYVTLGQYKGLEVTLASTEVTEDDIQSRYESDCNMNDQMEEITEGTTVEEGDIANIDYEGTLDGEAFDGGTDKGYDLTIGSGAFIEGFEDGLIGKNVGDSVDLNLTFPENYGSTELAGKDVVFHVTINSVKRVPEMTDEVVQAISDYETVDDYRSNITAELEEEKVASQRSQEINDLYTLLYSGTTINSYPEDVVNFRVDQMKAFYEDLAAQSDMEFADFLSQNFGMTEDDFDEQAPMVVEQGMVQELLLLGVAESENMTITDEEYEESLDRYVESTGSESREALLEQYTERDIRRSILMDKALDFMVENAVVVDASETESESETAGSEAVSETAAESETEAQSESESETETTSETEAAAESDSEEVEVIGGADGPTSISVGDETETETASEAE